MDAASILSALAAYEATAGSSDGEIDLTGASNREIVDHIVGRHHRYLREELPRLVGLSAKVVQAHGDREPRLADIYLELGSLRRGLEEHLNREERELFPIIASGSLLGEGEARTVSGYEQEHEEAGASLKRLRELSDSYTAPEWACNTFRAFYDGLRELEADIHEHVHKENNILFPRLRRVT